ncbi:hypothetical protein RclHR1_28350001 [Rhizophagus clarus]|uniref:Uncharacterized protein n=1 Tax=Rhizophagus clarus TaxID=94130 RepID=A0A2Z6R7D2_9GLOM|nr:hypothetical protein RclHR1_28350001 [Rhizophagus clarus]GES76025.1 hypothetical protein RCL_jg20319.t1 [Rhizophagus clarus]
MRRRKSKNEENLINLKCLTGHRTSSLLRSGQFDFLFNNPLNIKRKRIKYLLGDRVGSKGVQGTLTLNGHKLQRDLLLIVLKMISFPSLSCK